MKTTNQFLPDYQVGCHVSLTPQDHKDLTTLAVKYGYSITDLIVGFALNQHLGLKGLTKEFMGNKKEVAHDSIRVLFSTSLPIYVDDLLHGQVLKWSFKKSSLITIVIERNLGELRYQPAKVVEEFLAAQIVRTLEIRQIMSTQMGQGDLSTP